MADALAVLSPRLREGLPRSAFPARVAPMLATLTEERFSDPAWLFERKLDGERCLVFRNAKGIRLRSRSGHRLGGTYPELVEAFVRQAGAFVVDGEVVAFAGSTTSFERLQQRIGVAHGDRRRRAVAVRLYLFDILHLDGYDLTQLPLRERKRVLRAAIRWHDPIRFTTHRNEKGEACFREACRKGWEGLIAKRADSAYVHRRSRDWLKFKCVHEQEFVVGGFTDAAGGRPGIGALLLGVFDGECLVYAGKVGTGWDEATRRALHERLRAKERKTSPFAGRVAAGKGARWTEPRMVVEVGFTEWTDAGRLRHPRFLGVRRDKAARKVVRERPRRSGRQP